MKMSLSSAVKMVHLAAITTLLMNVEFLTVLLLLLVAHLQVLLHLVLAHHLAALLPQVQVAQVIYALVPVVEYQHAVLTYLHLFVQAVALLVVSHKPTIASHNSWFVKQLLVVHLVLAHHLVALQVLAVAILYAQVES